MRAGVFNARNVRTWAGDKPKPSCRSRRLSFLDCFLLFKVDAAILLESLRNYTEVNSKACAGSTIGANDCAVNSSKGPICGKRKTGNADYDSIAAPSNCFNAPTYSVSAFRPAPVIR